MSEKPDEIKAQFQDDTGDFLRICDWSCLACYAHYMQCLSNFRLKMFPLSLYLTLQADSCGRIDKNALPQETLLELLVADLKGCEAFRDSEGSYTAIATWPGLEFNDSGDVTGIDCEFDAFSDIFDADYVPLVKQGGSIDLAFLPHKLKKFIINCMKLAGTVDTSTLPRGLELFEIETNAFFGSFVVGDLPRGMTYLYVQDNKLSGSFHLEDLPPALQTLDASHNCFEGSLDFSKLPDTLEYLFMQHNKFSGSISLGHTPPRLVNLWINQNNFAQDVLRIGGHVVKVNGVRLDEGAFGLIIDPEGKDLEVTKQWGHITVQTPGAGAF